jgi:predicted permease
VILLAAHGGAGAIAVFAVFVVAFAVLIGFVIRFVRQQSRRQRGGGGPQT